ncbi:hypothetical protein F8M41_009450 [Gigaspora margarita]|uniref:Uncharacterized protein n=1 Tax=Gigaspora margarita TaxID=4874 RepID=A0A8H3X2Z4_GIGMA|nr:hypothetical protein F8M41_009450 [Gigaspora margarita]
MPVKNWKKKVFEAFKLFSPSNKDNHIDDRGCWSSSESEAGSSRLSVISSRSRRSSFNRSINSFHEETEFSECSTDFTGLYKCPKCSQSRSQQDWSIDEKLSNISESSDEEVNVHPKAIYSSRPLSGIITQRYGLESTLSQNNSRKSISLKNSVIQDKDKKIKEVIPKKRQSKFALTKRISSSNNDIPIIEIHKYDSEPSDEEEN